MAFCILMLIGQLSVVLVPCMGILVFNTHFQKVQTRNVTMVTFLNVTVESKISCASQCAKNHVDCYSYSYDNHNCMLGSWLTPSNTTLDAKTHLYTVGAFCNVTEKFRVLKNGSSSACVRLSSDMKNFSDARAACQAFGTGVDLYTMKYAAKYYMIAEVLQRLNQTVWVGLEDRAQEDVFKFVDDGSVLKQELRNLTFAPGEPNNKGDEDCVSFNADQLGFNDDNCLEKAFYACERSPHVKFDIQV